jgi:hypothetical protein
MNICSIAGSKDARWPTTCHFWSWINNNFKMSVHLWSYGKPLLDFYTLITIKGGRKWAYLLRGWYYLWQPPYVVNRSWLLSTACEPMFVTGGVVPRGSNSPSCGRRHLALSDIRTLISRLTWNIFTTHYNKKHDRKGLIHPNFPCFLCCVVCWMPLVVCIQCRLLLILISFIYLFVYPSYCKDLHSWIINFHYTIC